jgi:energy-coupling factor transporter ATP-binding protein EcfA2
MADENRNGLSEAMETGASAARTIRGAIKTGKAISAAAKGAAAGGPYGAVAGAIWAGRKHIGKILAAIAVLLLLPVLFVLMLPSLIFGGLTDAFSSTDPEVPILNSSTAIVENANNIAFTVSGVLNEGLADVTERIQTDFDLSDGDQMEVVNPYTSNPVYNANLLASQYCAANDQQTVSEQKLLDSGSATAEMLHFLKACIRYGVSVCIAGSTGSGKTTIMAWLLSNVPNNRRLITIEEGSREFDLVKRDEDGNILNSVVHLLTRPHENPTMNINQDFLLERVLRKHPDVIGIGEMRSAAESLSAAESSRTGHTVCTTIHSNSCVSTYRRMMTLAKRKYSINEPVRSCFDTFVFEAELINANTTSAINSLKMKLPNRVFHEWCSILIQCQSDRSMKHMLPTVAQKFSDIRVVQSELEAMMNGPRREAITMMFLVIGNIPLLYFLNKDWFHTLLFTTPGKVALAVCAGILLFSLTQIQFALSWVQNLSLWLLAIWRVSIRHFRCFTRGYAKG